MRRYILFSLSNERNLSVHCPLKTIKNDQKQVAVATTSAAFSFLQYNYETGILFT